VEGDYFKDGFFLKRWRGDHMFTPRGLRFSMQYQKGMPTFRVQKADGVLIAASVRVAGGERSLSRETVNKEGKS